MWFVFGFITLISFSIYFGYRRINAAWEGSRETVNGLSFQYKVLRGKYGITGLLVGIDGPSEYDCALKKETSVDRFFKSVGFSVEHQIGSREFDDLIYVVSDSSLFHQKLSSSEVLSESAINMFRLAEKFNCKVKVIRCNSGRLWVHFKTRGGFDEDKIQRQSLEASRLLKTIAGELEIAVQPLSLTWRDPFVIKSALILAISTGLAINGFLYLFRLAWIKIPFTVDSSQLWLDSVLWGAGIILAMLLATIFFLGRSARAHLVMIELIFVGAFGAVSTVFAELREINIELDESVAAIYEVTARDKRISKSRRSTSYYLSVDDWNKDERRREVKVPGSFYQSVSVGDKLLVKQKAGYLNYRWVESIKKKRISSY